MISFFGKVDRNKEGHITSTTPAWTMKGQIEELEEEIGRKERALERGDIPVDSIPNTKDELRKEKKRLGEILEGRPKLTETDENKLWKIHKDLATAIKPSLFSRSEMLKGLASPHEEMRRMKEPVMNINKDIAEFCEANNIKVTEQKGGLYVSRDNAAHAWKMIGKYFGEAANVESLRRD